MIIPHSNVYKCFGCGAEGGPIDFLMRLKNKTRDEIVDEVGKKTFVL
jgi:DNA primase